MSAESEAIEVMLETTLKSAETAEELTAKICNKAGFDEDERHQIEMAVHESMINAVRHGNKHDRSKRVWLSFRLFPDRLEIRIRDQGTGFDLGRVPDPLEAENLLKVSGRGIFLIRSFVDEFRVYNLRGEGAEVILVKYRDLRKKLGTRGKAS
ncbi:MAG: ATP-binding protein [Terriglobia bacterium]